MNTKEMDIVRVCRDILSFRDESVDLWDRAQDLQKQSYAADDKVRQATRALAILLGEKFEPKAFQTFDPTGGHSIIVVVGKADGVSPSVRRLEILKNSVDDEEETL